MNKFVHAFGLLELRFQFQKIFIFFGEIIYFVFFFSCRCQCVDFFPKFNRSLGRGNKNSNFFETNPLTVETSIFLDLKQKNLKGYFALRFKTSFQLFQQLRFCNSVLLFQRYLVLLSTIKRTRKNEDKFTQLLKTFFFLQKRNPI